MEHLSGEYILRVLRETAGQEYRFTEADRQRVLHNSDLENELSALRADGEFYRGKPLPALSFSLFKLHETTGERYRYDEVFLERRKILTAWAMLAWLYERDEDISILEDVIWAVCDEYSWALPAHLFFKGLTELQTEDNYVIDLFAAETAGALAEILSLVGDKLRPIVRARAEYEIERRVIRRYLATEHGWERETNNWVAVCGGSIGIAALYLEKDDERLAEILLRVTEAMHNFYRGYPDDGACTEGVSYWEYGFGFFTYFAALLKRRTAGRIDLFSDEKVHRMAAFPVRTAFGGGAYVNFADAEQGYRLSRGLIAYLADTYGDISTPSRELLATVGEGLHANPRLAITLRNLVWTGADAESALPRRQSVNIFPQAQWYLAEAESGVGIAAKGGHNGEEHNHNDVGSFHIFKRGKVMFADLGSPRYVADYFSEKRYGFFCASSESHNVPVVNGNYQKSGRQFCAKNVRINDDGLTMDLAPAYGLDGLESLVRELRFDRVTGETRIRDVAVWHGAPCAFVEHLLVVGRPQIGEGEIVVENGERMRVLFDAALFTADFYEREDTSHDGTPRHSYVIELKPKEGATTVEFRIAP